MRLKKSMKRLKTSDGASVWELSGDARYGKKTDESFRGAYCPHHQGDEAYSSPWESDISPSLGFLKAGYPFPSRRVSRRSAPWRQSPETKFSAALYSSLDTTKRCTPRPKCHPRWAICCPLTPTWGGGGHCTDCVPRLHSRQVNT
jgi:hypothetical protein